jgi:hypothetical protein
MVGQDDEFVPSHYTLTAPHGFNARANKDNQNRRNLLKWMLFFARVFTPVLFYSLGDP